MLKNYFLITLRTLQRQKGYAIINILGLSVGLASALLIFLYIQNELSYNSQFKNAENTFRLGLVITDPEGNIQPLINVPGGWNNRMVEQLSQIQAGTKYFFMGMPTSIHDKSKDKIILTEDILWVSPETPEVMYFPLIQGNIDKVFVSGDIAYGVGSINDLICVNVSNLTFTYFIVVKNIFIGVSIISGILSFVSIITVILIKIWKEYPNP